MHLLQTLFSLAKKGQANALAIDGQRELAQSQAHWRYMITDLLRGLAKSHPYGQLTEARVRPPRRDEARHRDPASEPGRRAIDRPAPEASAGPLDALRWSHELVGQAPR